MNFFILNAADHELVICLTCGSVGICDFFLLNAVSINLYFFFHSGQFKLVIFFLLNTARYELIICSFQVKVLRLSWIGRLLGKNSSTDAWKAIPNAFFEKYGGLNFLL